MESWKIIGFHIFFNSVFNWISTPGVQMNHFIMELLNID
jgi:hypothetical protein